jgi:hypothetical protein
MGKYTDLIRKFETERGLVGSVGFVGSAEGTKAELLTPGAVPKGERKASKTVTNSPCICDKTDQTDQTPYRDAFKALESRCPEYVPPERWQRAVTDSRLFLGRWGRQAEALNWTSGDLFGLHEPPTNPHASYNRLSRLDATGLLWVLNGRRVTALSSTVAATGTSSGGILKYRKQ